jgi:polar amino acid transport system permease protein
MGHNWDFGTILGSWDVLLIGLKGTITIFLVTLALGLGGGLVVGILRYARNPVVRFLARTFVEIFRNVPVLVQIVWFFFALPVLTGLEVSPFLAAALGISLNTMAFSAEIYRAGIQSIESGQWEAGKAIGMTHGQTMRRIILPVAIKRVIPPLTNRGIEVFKMSTLASVVGYTETLKQAKLIADLNFNPIESYTAVAVIFFVVLYPVVQATYVMERVLRRSE